MGRKNFQNTFSFKTYRTTKKLILATTLEDDLICDPASGGYSVFEACKLIKRNFIGCDIIYGEDKIDEN